MEREINDVWIHGCIKLSNIYIWCRWVMILSRCQSRWRLRLHLRCCQVLLRIGGLCLLRMGKLQYDKTGKSISPTKSKQKEDAVVRNSCFICHSPQCRPWKHVNIDEKNRRLGFKRKKYPDLWKRWIRRCSRKLVGSMTEEESTQVGPESVSAMKVTVAEVSKTPFVLSARPLQ